MAGAGEAREARLAAFGRWLLQERELRALARHEVVAATRLAPGVVEALEAGDPARFPPGAYLQGSLRAYAAAVGLDADEVVLRCQEAMGEEVPGPAAAPAGRRLSPQGIAAALVALAAVLALLGWLWRLR
jgi:hypothetical protein